LPRTEKQQSAPGSFFEKQIKFATSNSDRAAPNFAFAILSLGDNDIEQATQHFNEANSMFANWVKSADEYFSGTDWLYWRKLFKSPDEFKARYKAAYDAMGSR
jgi:hypothetical protein